MTNMFKTALLLTSVTVFLILLGGFVGGRNGLLVAVILAALMNFVSYFYSDRIVLALYRAQRLLPGQLPQLPLTVQQQAQRASLPVPKIYLIANDSPNAVATGRDPRHASVAITQGLLNLLSAEELERVLAHELGHGHNRDNLLCSIAPTLAGAVTLLAEMGYGASLFGGLGGRENDRERAGGLNGLLMIILAPIAARLIQLVVSRARDYQADTCSCSGWFISRRRTGQQFSGEL